MFEKAKNIDEAQAIADDVAKGLTEKYQTEVTAKVVSTGSDYVAGYFIAPNRLMKMQALDMAATSSLTMANDNLLRVCLLADDSDPRILDESPVNDPIYLAFNMFASTLVEMYNINVQKKS